MPSGLLRSLYREAGEVSIGLVHPLLRKGEGILRITAYWNGVRLAKILSLKPIQSDVPSVRCARRLVRFVAAGLL